MKTSHLLVILGCLAAVGCGLYVAFTYLASPVAMSPAGHVASRPQGYDHGGGDRVELSALRRDIDQIRAEMQDWHGVDAGAGTRLQEFADTLRRLQHDVAELHNRMQQRAPMAEAAAKNRDDTPAASSLTEDNPETRSEEQEQRDRARQAMVETHFQAETVDSQWSADTSDLIGQILEHEDLIHTDVFGVDCRARTCRLEVEHADTEAASQFELLFPLEMAEVLPQMQFYQQQLEDGHVNTVLYLTREGK